MNRYNSPVMEDLKNSFMIDMESLISGSMMCAGNISNFLVSIVQGSRLSDSIPMLPLLETKSGTETKRHWSVQGWLCFVFSVLVRVLG